MDFRCTNCDKTTSFVANPPKFCPECGAPNQDYQTAIVGGDATIAPSKNAQEQAELLKPLAAETRIANYRLVKPLGSGGMGVVWEAIEDKTERRVALKTLHSQSLQDVKTVQRFIREAKLAAKLSHPNVTFIYGAGEHKGKHFIAMELMPGDTLADRVSEQGPMPIEDGVDAILDVVDGLISAHRLGLIHRDVKPSNCFVAKDGSVKIGDFGLSKSTVHSDMNLTQDATFLGTPSYSAPEQIRGIDLDARTDIYAIGATLYQLLTGRTPFVGESIAVTAQIIADPVSPARSWNNQIPVALDKIICTCLEKSKDSRYQTLTSLRKALTPFGSQGTSLADFGRRMSAYTIDYVLISVVNMMIGVIFIFPKAFQARGDQEVMSEAVLQLQPILIPITVGLSFLYFFLSEWLIGKTIGKHLLKLQVVDESNSKPGFFRALLRVAIFPLFLGIPLLIQLLFLNQKFGIDSGSQLLQMMTGILLMAVPMAICFSSMRVRNGLRGLHEFASGTHVQRVHVNETQNFTLSATKPATKPMERTNFGQFVADQFLCDTEAGKIFLGYDKHLDRDVWICESTASSPPSTARIELSRPGRQRWLDGNVSGDKRWDAYEPVEGISVLAVVGSKRNGEWKNYRVLLEQVALELRAAIEDQTLPETLYLSQVIINDEGNVKILDRHPLDVVKTAPTLEMLDYVDCDGDNPDHDAVCLFKDLASLVGRRQSELPFSAQDFFLELADKPHDPSTLDWVIERLSALADTLPSLQWDSRFGVLGITIVFEGIAHFILSSMIFMFVIHYAPIPMTLKIFVGMVLSLALPFGFGMWMKGGPVFRMMGIGVANKNGKPVGGLRCGIRSAIAWLPQTTFIGTSILANIVAWTPDKLVQPGSIAQQLKDNDGLMLTVFLLLMGSMLITIGATVFTIASAKRGLQDYAVGTRLIPK